MEWIKIILPLIGVAMGWLLSERGKVFADKRQDKRKLKKLLFFLLELRYHFARELSHELVFDKCLVIIKDKMVEKLGIDKDDPELNQIANVWKPFLEQMITKIKTQDDKFEYLSENIDKILIELAEIFPILAYELSGRHNIKERLNKADGVLNELSNIGGEIPFDFDVKRWINPKLTKELLEDLDESIEKIAKQIDAETLNSANEKIKKMTFDEDDENDMEEIIDEYLEKIIENISKK